MELMKNNNIIIIGAGGFGREVMWLIERINKVSYRWNVLGFVDDDTGYKNKMINGYRVLGNLNWLQNYGEKVNVVYTVADPNMRKKIVTKLYKNDNVKFTSLIDPSVKYSENVDSGEGSIICADVILTVNIVIGKHVIINLDCTVGHDAVLNEYVTLYPSVNVSGNVLVEECVEIGTGSNIIQGLGIGRNIVIGAGSVVVKDLKESGTYVGVPVRKIS